MNKQPSFKDTHEEDMIKSGVRYENPYIGIHDGVYYSAWEYLKRNHQKPCEFLMIERISFETYEFSKSYNWTELEIWETKAGAEIIRKEDIKKIFIHRPDNTIAVDAYNEKDETTRYWINTPNKTMTEAKLAMMWLTEILNNVQ